MWLYINIFFTLGGLSAKASFQGYGIHGEITFTEINQRYVEITVNISGLQNGDSYNWEVRSLPVIAGDVGCTEDDVGKL